MVLKVYNKILFYINKMIIINNRKKIKLIGENSIISYGTIEYAEKIIIGENCYIGPQYRLYGRGGISIGDGVIIGPRVTIHTSNHNYDSSDLKALPYDNVVKLKKVNIEQNVWVGDNVMICPGVTIGEGAIIGMGTVVSKNIPSYSIVVGNPCKVVKSRNIDIYNRLKENKQIYMKLKSQGMIMHCES